MSREILKLPLVDIEIAERVGYYDAEHAAGLAVAMDAEGQHDPIHVAPNSSGAAKPWRLVAGRHRIGAAELLGWSAIDALPVAEAGAHEAELLCLELSENLDHRKLRPVERAKLIAARASLEEAIDYPDTLGESQHVRGARVRHTALRDVAGPDSGPAENWRERTARASGISLARLKEYRAIDRAIVAAFPELAEPLNFHQLGDNFTAIHGIAQIKHEGKRRCLIEAIIANPDLATLDAAKTKVGTPSKGGRMSQRDRAAATFVTSWEDMPLAQQRAAAPTFARRILPSVANIIAANLTPDAAKAMAEVLKNRGLLS